MGFEIISGRNSGYPCIPELRELSAEMREPPCCEYMMSCFGSGVNGGYPWIGQLEAITEEVRSELFFNGRQAVDLYFGDEQIRQAYCNGRSVYERRFKKRRIV